MKKAVFLALCWALAGMLEAQEFRATISGVATDSSGAPVAQALMVATNTATNVPTSPTSNAAGVYDVPLILDAPIRNPTYNESNCRTVISLQDWRNLK